MDLVLCKICKEPIWNFLCVDCLAKDVKKVIPKWLLKDFFLFHRRMVKNFHSYYDRTYCLKCKHESYVVVCPYCYLNEALSEMSKKAPILAKKLVRSLPFFKHPYTKKEARTITEFTNRKTTYGVCDECGEYSEYLEKTDRGWLCENCRE